MPYNTRRKSLSLSSLGIHIPTTHAARAAAAAAAAAAASASSNKSASPSSSATDSSDPHPSKRTKRSHAAPSPHPAPAPLLIRSTPPDQPPSPALADSIEMVDADSAADSAADAASSTATTKIDLSTVKDDIVQAALVQLQTTGNRPHLVKDLAIILGRSLTSVQQSANPCAIVSSRLASYIKRTTWTTAAPCPLAKELETVHPRRTYFFLTTQPRQQVPDTITTLHPTPPSATITPSVSLTDDSGSDDDDSRRRELSPSPEVDLSPHDFGDDFDDMLFPGCTPASSLTLRRARVARDFSHTSPPLEKDEREFTQTADVLLKRKLTDDQPLVLDPTDRSLLAEYGYREDLWFAENHRSSCSASSFLVASPTMKPTTSSLFFARRDEEADSWLRLFEGDQGAESIDIDELESLLDSH